MAGHALLSPSAASRWLTCTPAPRLEALFPDKSSEFADEGTVAYAVAEFYLRNLDDELGFEIDIEAAFSDDKLGPMFEEHYSDELKQHAIDFGDFVLEEAVGDHALLIEQKLDLRMWGVPEGFGTGDAIVVRDGTLFMNDLKYGRGVKVSAVENKQLMLYALGCIDAYSFLYGFDTISLRIYQPRLNNISIWSITVKELEEWAKEVAVKAKLAFEGKGEFVAGEHCRFCKAAPKCKALADHAFEKVKEEFAEDEGPAQMNGLMSMEEIKDVMDRLPVAEIFFKQVKEYVFSKLLSGEKVPGYKLVKGKASRYFKDPDKVEKTLVKAGFSDKIYTEPIPAQLKTLSAIEKSIKKSNFTKLLSDFVGIKEGNPNLAPEKDAREEYSSLESDFADD